MTAITWFLLGVSCNLVACRSSRTPEHWEGALAPPARAAIGRGTSIKCSDMPPHLSPTKRAATECVGTSADSGAIVLVDSGSREVISVTMTWSVSQASLHDRVNSRLQILSDSLGAAMKTCSLPKVRDQWTWARNGHFAGLLADWQRHVIQLEFSTVAPTDTTCGKEGQDG